MKKRNKELFLALNLISAGNISSAQRECIRLAEIAAQKNNEENKQTFSKMITKEEYDLILFVRR